MKKILLFIFCLLSVSSYAAYKGQVFIDNNNNKVYDKGDTPLSGVAVTDGRNVVKTAKDGMYTLSGYDKTRFISVTTPSGYKVEQFYLPVDDVVKSYDFILEKDTRDRAAHSFIQIADTEIPSRGVGAWSGILKKYIANENVAFLIHTGDICYEDGLKAHIQVMNNKTMDCPVYYCIGNHDLVKGDYGEQLYESIYGPTWYSFDVGNVHYVITPMSHGDYKPSYTIDEVYQWLKNDLAAMPAGKKLVVFNHDILTTGNDIFFGPKDAEQIDLRKFNILAWVYGHWHYNYVRNQNGVYTICVAPPDKGGIDHSASAFRVISIDAGDKLSTQLHYCYVEPQAQIASPQAGQIVKGTIPVVVNAYYSAAEVAEVSYRLAEKGSANLSEPKALKRQSAWTWGDDAGISQTLSGKEIDLHVTAKFSDGQTVISKTTFKNGSSSSSGVKLGDNWYTLSGNAQHTAENKADIKLPLQLAWTKNIGLPIFMSSPVIAEGCVFVAAVNDDILKDKNYSIEGGVFCLDAKSGEIKWSYATRNSIKNSIAYTSGLIFAQDAEGWLYAIDSKTGQLRWENKIDVGFPYVCEGLTADNGVVYAGTGIGLTAFKTTDGSIIWRNNDWKKGEAASTTVTLTDGVVVAATQWVGLYGNDAITGKLLWKRTEQDIRHHGSSATLHNGKIYINSYNNFFIIDPKTGEIEKQKQFSEYSVDATSTPLVTDTEIILGTADKGLLALDKESLAIKWNTPTGQSLVYTVPYTTIPFAAVETSPVAVNGIIYFGASDGCLYGLKAGTGEIVWKVCTGAPVLASVAVSGNTLFAVDFGGNVYAFVSDTN